MLARGSSTDEIRQAHRDAGGRSLLEEGLRLAEAEMTSLEEVGRVALFD